MGFQSMNGGMSQVIDCLQVTLEHVRVLVILGRDILLECRVKGDMVGTAEGQLQKISACHSACDGREVVASQNGSWKTYEVMVEAAAQSHMQTEGVEKD